MRSLIKLSVGFALVLILGYLSIHENALPGSRADAARKLEALAAPAGAMAPWAGLRVDGQTLIVSGAAPTPAAREAFLAALGPTNVFTGPFSKIDASALRIAAPEAREPHIWVAERVGAVLNLSGETPSQAARDAVYSEAKTVFPDLEIAGELDTAPSPASEDDWIAAAQAALVALDRLKAGAAELADETLTLTGEAPDRPRLAAAQALLSSVPPSIAVRTELTLHEAQAAPENENENIHENKVLQEISASLTKAEETSAPTIDCAAELSRLTTMAQIRFGSDDAAMEEASRPILDDIAAVHAACPAILLTIVGHTDSAGSARGNAVLSKKRADAVAAYLAAHGAPAGRLETRGAGETAPLVSNATPAGRARNRRIEFEVEPASSP